ALPIVVNRHIRMRQICSQLRCTAGFSEPIQGKQSFRTNHQELVRILGFKSESFVGLRQSCFAFSLKREHSSELAVGPSQLRQQRDGSIECGDLKLKVLRVLSFNAAGVKLDEA